MKKKIFKKSLAVVAALSLLLTIVPLAGQSATESFLDLSVTVTDSAPEATGVEYTIEFTTGEGEAIADNHVFIEIMDDEFFDRGGVLGDEEDMSCGDNLSGSAAVERDIGGQTVVGLRCDIDAGVEEGDTMTASFDNVTNPDKEAPAGEADSYLIMVEDEDEIERGTAKVAIIEDVTVSARIDATLNFEVRGVNEGHELHGHEEDVTTVDSDPDAIEFGTLLPHDGTDETLYIAAQELRVKTNATEGYTVTVFQDGDLMSAAGDRISPFNNGTVIDPDPDVDGGTIGWESPLADLDDEDTWGHFGYTTEDTGVRDGCDAPDVGDGWFASPEHARWAGFDGDTERQVMCHTGPVPDPDGGNEEENINRTYVGYQVEISQLQPAGEYNNTLTYIATPTF